MFKDCLFCIAFGVGAGLITGYLFQAIIELAIYFGG